MVELRLDRQRPAKKSLLDNGENELGLVWKAVGSR